MALDQKGISISSGSACRSGSPKPSGTLLAMGLTEEEAHCTVRISLGIGNTEEDIKQAIDAFAEIVNDSKNIVRFVPCR
jgi:cysteine sulfinate desulfinase/cysteine desulfurase-like protein